MHIKLLNKTQTTVCIIMSSCMLGLTSCNSNDKNAGEISIIEARSAMLQCNLHDALKFYKIAILHDPNSKESKNNCQELENAITYLSNEEFELASNSLNKVELISSCKPLQKLSNFAHALGNNHDTIISDLEAKNKQSNKVEEITYNSLQTLEENSSKIDIMEDMYHAIYVLSDVKTNKFNRDSSSMKYLFSVNSVWKTVSNQLENRELQLKLVNYGVQVTDIKGVILPTSKIIDYFQKETNLSESDKKELPVMVSGLRAGEAFKEHFNSYIPKK
jgi:hypothetical protein